MPKKTAAIRTAAAMMAITLLGKALGLLRDSLAGSYFGTQSVEGAAFNFASTLPRNLLDFMFASAISASFIPLFNEALEKDGKKAAMDLGRSFMSLIFFLSTAATAICIIFAEPMVALYAGKNVETVPIATELARIMFPIIIVSCLAFSSTGILQSLGEFNIPAAMGLACNIVIVGYFFLFMDRFGVRGLSWAYLAGWAMQMVIQIPFLLKEGHSFIPRIDFKDERLKRIGILMLPVMASSWVAPVNSLVNGKAALMDANGVASYNAVMYANTLHSVISGVFVLTVSNIMLPRFSSLAARHEEGEFRDSLSDSLKVILFITIPMALGLAALSGPLVSLVYERGNFNEISTRLTGSALAYFSLGMPAFGAMTILSRGFFAMQEGKTPMLAGFAAMAANFALSFALVPYMGPGGPALASSVSMAVAALWMGISMSRKLKGFANKKSLIEIGKSLIGAIACAGAALALERALSGIGNGLLIKLVCLAASAGVGVLAYVGVTLLLRQEQAAAMVKMIKAHPKFKNGMR
ncbi:MAG: murein biosynthesis integral membrane protein MurJ [Clostridiales bacterium]|jgi:putative peptidoglycan lipid II flippase|nr:murein biosynthesis integral membrane protein MurJ [Clostridiales bacterium]